MDYPDDACAVTSNASFNGACSVSPQHTTAVSVALQAHLSHWLLPPMDGSPHDLIMWLYIAVLLLSLRSAAERAILPRLAKALAAASNSSTPAAASAVFDHSVAASWAAAMTACGWWVMLRHNGGCTPLNPAPCLEGWPATPVSPAFRWYWFATGGYYVHELLATVLQLTTAAQPPDMVFHHLMTLLLYVSAYSYGIHRSGLMMVCLVDLSTPLLCASKALHASGLPQLKHLKLAIFAAFAATFFVARVVLPPYSLLYPSLMHAPSNMPAWGYAANNLLLCGVYLMQWWWLQKILHVLRKQLRSGGAEVGADAGVHLKGGALNGSHAGAKGATPNGVHTSTAAALNGGANGGRKAGWGAGAGVHAATNGVANGGVSGGANGGTIGSISGSCTHSAGDEAGSSPASVQGLAWVDAPSGPAGLDAYAGTGSGKGDSAWEVGSSKEGRQPALRRRA